MASTSFIEIKSDALKNNVNFIKTNFNDDIIISAVIKGNAYGHGTDVILPALENLGINHFSVYSSPEAKAALECKKKSSTIMIMGFIYPDDFEWIIKNQIEFYIYEINELIVALKIAKSLNKKALIHLDVETGMNRTGLTLRDLKKVIKIINANKDFIYIKGVTTHLAGAESIANHMRVKKQLSIFKKRIKFLKDNGINFDIKHVASSAAAISYPKTQFDLVRIGILLYGYWPSKETLINFLHKKKLKTDPLDRVIRWKSYIMSIKKIKEGDFVGYGLGFQAQRNMTIMIVPVGYANGYSRSLSNNGYVLVNSNRATVIGYVNMNMIICDITEVDNVKIGDMVVLIGKLGDNEISFASFAEMNNSLNYEILARLPENIERVFK